MRRRPNTSSRRCGLARPGGAVLAAAAACCARRQSSASFCHAPALASSSAARWLPLPSAATTRSKLRLQSFRPAASSVARHASREELLMQAAASKAGRVELSPLSEGDLLLNTVVFLGFCIPFLYAAYEFWRRIAFGQQFGTGDDPVVFPKPGEEEQPLVIKEAPRQKPRRIGKDGQVTIGMDADTNRGRRVLGQDALAIAYVLMFMAAASVALAAVSVYPVFSGQSAVGPA